MIYEWFTGAATPSGNPFIDWLTSAGALGILAFLVVAFMKEWIVPGARATRAEADARRAMDLLLEANKVSSQTLDIAEKKVG